MERYHRTTIGRARRLRTDTVVSPLALLPWALLAAATLLPLLG